MTASSLHRAGRSFVSERSTPSNPKHPTRGLLKMLQKCFHTLVLALAFAGSAGSASAQISWNTDITTNTTWNGEYVLEKPIFVKNNATLTIVAGSIIRGQPRSGAVVAGSTVGSPGAIIVTQAGRIVAEGTKGNGATPGLPIIMTTAAIDNVNNTTLLPPADGVADDVDDNGFEDKWTVAKRLPRQRPEERSARSAQQGRQGQRRALGRRGHPRQCADQRRRQGRARLRQGDDRRAHRSGLPGRGRDLRRSRCRTTTPVAFATSRSAMPATRSAKATS